MSQVIANTTSSSPRMCAGGCNDDRKIIDELGGSRRFRLRGQPLFQEENEKKIFVPVER